MKPIYHFLILMLTAFSFHGCSKADLNSHAPIDTGGAAPATVTNVQVTNLPGAAVLTYTLPKDDNLQYVMAEYSINSTTVRQAKTSRYNDTIFVDGFNASADFAVKLYSVSKSEVRSAAVT